MNAYRLIFFDYLTVHREGTVTFGIARTGKKLASSAKLYRHAAAANRALEFGVRVAKICGLAELIFFLNVFFKRTVKIFKCFCVLLFALGDKIQLVFHISGKSVAYVFAEIILKEC